MGGEEGLGVKEVEEKVTVGEEEGMQGVVKGVDGVVTVEEGMEGWGKVGAEVALGVKEAEGKEAGIRGAVMGEDAVVRVEEGMEGWVGVEKEVGWEVMGVEEMVSWGGEGEAVGEVVVGERDWVVGVKVEAEMVVGVMGGIGHKSSDSWPCIA